MLLSNLALIAVLVAAAYLILFRRHARLRSAGSSSQEAAARTADPAPKKNEFAHSVSISLGRRPCAAAQELVSQRFVSSDVPRLPLSACDRELCECRYGHHGDRRESTDRRLPFTTMSSFVVEGPEGERRERDERRQS